MLAPTAAASTAVRTAHRRLRVRRHDPSVSSSPAHSSVCALAA